MSGVNLATSVPVKMHLRPVKSLVSKREPLVSGRLCSQDGAQGGPCYPLSMLLPQPTDGCDRDDGDQ